MIEQQRCNCGMPLGLHVMANGRSHTCAKCNRVWMMQNSVAICIMSPGQPSVVSRQNPITALEDRLKETGGPVVHPEHYNACGGKDGDGSVEFEPIKVIESWGWGYAFCMACAVKYILRAPHKGSERADLEKTLWYLERAIGNQKSDQSVKSDNPCNVVDVVEAWGLPERLMMAIGYIFLGNPGAAAHNVTLYLSAMNTAHEIAEDKEILVDVEEKLARGKAHICADCIHRKWAGYCDQFHGKKVEEHDGRDCDKFKAGDGFLDPWR